MVDLRGYSWVGPGVYGRCEWLARLVMISISGYGLGVRA